MSGQAYREWHQNSVSVNGSRYVVATKPGVFGDGHVDPAALMLAEHARVNAGDVVVHMGSGNGLVPAVAATTGGAARVIAADRNVISAEATRRTLRANSAANAAVIASHGSLGMPQGLVADAVMIRVAQEKLALIQLLVDASRLLRVGGRVYIAGATNEGIKAGAKLLDLIFGASSVIAYGSGCRVITAHKLSSPAAGLDDEDMLFTDPNYFRRFDAVVGGRPLTLFSRPGVFSWEHIDEATQILADVMDIPLRASVLDLGCGTGALGITASFLSGGGAVTMLDADVEAIRSAAMSAHAAGISNFRVITSDVAGEVLGEQFDVVVTNPPFHVGKQTDLAVPMQFIEDAWQVLSPGGRVFLVANRTLPYEAVMKTRFGSFATIHDGPRFKVLSATKEKR